MSDFETWQRWENQPWLKRDEKYNELNNQIAEHAIDLINRQLPGFKELVDYSEVSTPLSVVSLAGHAGGAIYGLLQKKPHSDCLTFGNRRFSTVRVGSLPDHTSH